MIRWQHLDTAKAPGGHDKLRLMQRGDEYSIMLGTNELMNSRLSGSEETLAIDTIAKLRHTTKPHVLIGGLGMGFTLRAALSVLGRDAQVTVVELVPQIIQWAGGPLAGVFNECLDDPRVSVVEGDVGAIIRKNKLQYDAILLDVDNGPDGLTRQSNDGIYSAPGLGAAKMALRAKGVLAVWSAGPNASFMQRLGRTGFTVEEARVHANGNRGQKKRGGARHVIWYATKR